MIYIKKKNPNVALEFACYVFGIHAPNEVFWAVAVATDFGQTSFLILSNDLVLIAHSQWCYDSFLQWEVSVNIQP